MTCPMKWLHRSKFTLGHCVMNACNTFMSSGRTGRIISQLLLEHWSFLISRLGLYSVITIQCKQISLSSSQNPGVESGQETRLLLSCKTHLYRPDMYLLSDFEYVNLTHHLPIEVAGRHHIESCVPASFINFSLEP